MRVTGWVRIIAGWIAIAVLSVALGAQTTWYVDQDATGANDGSSWDDAFVDLKSGLLLASGADEIHVAEGVYKPDQGSMLRTSTFGFPVATNSIALRGGFAGVGAPDPNLRDFDLHMTVLSGDLLGDDGPNFSNRSDNCYHVVQNAATLDGLTIRGGNANGTVFVDDRGGGVNDVTEAMIDCVIMDNQARGRGAGVFGSCKLTERCLFSGNRVGNVTNPQYQIPQGGGLYLLGGPGFTAPPYEVVDCVFSGNSGVAPGNVSVQGVGAYLDDISSVLGCTFQDNVGVSRSRGVGLYLTGESPSQPQITVGDCSFIGNTSPANGSLGAGAYLITTDVLDVTGCLFAANSVPQGEGGGCYVLGGLQNADLDDCLIIGNSALRGGGIFSTSSLVDIINCSVSGNLATDVGGGAYGSHDQLSSIFWGNLAAGAMSTEEAQIATASTAGIKADYCCIEGLTGAVVGTGNIASDPFFVDQNGADNILGTVDDNLNLLFGSPCIDTGDPDPMFFDPDGTVADMGALPTTQDPVPPTWVDLGFGSPGTLGEPLLTGTGDLSAGSTVTLTLSNVLPFSQHWLVLGLTPIYRWFKLGTFVPFPDLIVPQGADALGQLSSSGPWPPGVPAGFTIFAQSWAMDPGGLIGWSASNGLAGVSQ